VFWGDQRAQLSGVVIGSLTFGAGVRRGRDLSRGSNHVGVCGEKPPAEQSGEQRMKTGPELNNIRRESGFKARRFFWRASAGRLVHL